MRIKHTSGASGYGYDHEIELEIDPDVQPEVSEGNLPTPLVVDSENGVIGSVDALGTTRFSAKGVPNAEWIILYDDDGSAVFTYSASDTPVAELDLAVEGSIFFRITYDATNLLNIIPLAGLIMRQGFKQSFVYTYDFAINGGAVGTIPLTGSVGLPNKFVITHAYIDVITGLTGAIGSTGALTTAQGAGDLVVATVIAGAPWSTAGIKATVPVGSAATAIKLTAERAPAFVVAVDAVTAGKFNLIIEGHQSS